MIGHVHCEDCVRLGDITDADVSELLDEYKHIEEEYEDYMYDEYDDDYYDDPCYYMDKYIKWSDYD